MRFPLAIGSDFRRLSQTLCLLLREAMVEAYGQIAV